MSRAAAWEVPLVAALAAVVFVAHDVPWVLAQPFWQDEAWVAVTTRMPIGDVPAHTSTAPIGFTLLLRAIVVGGDQAVRLLPLVFSSGCVVSAYCLGRGLGWRDRRQAVLAGVLAACAALLVPSALYRNDLKQFTAEAFACVTVLALTANAESRESRRSLALLAGAVVATKLVAHTVVFAASAAFISLAAVAMVRRHWRWLFEVVAAAVTSGLGVLAIYLAFDRRADTPELEDFWGDFFPPADRGLGGVRDYLTEHYDVLEQYVGIGPIWLAAAFVLAGLITAALAGRPAVALTVLVLLVELFVAGLARKYPLLDLRTSHFLFVTLGVMGGIGAAGAAAMAGRVAFAGSLAVAALFVGLYVHESAPYLRAHTGSIFPSSVPSQVRYIARHRRPGDAIVVNLRGGYAFGYYWRADPPGFASNPGMLPDWRVTYPQSARIVVAHARTDTATADALRRAWRLVRGDGRVWIVRTYVFSPERAMWRKALGDDSVTQIEVGFEPLLLAGRSMSEGRLPDARLRVSRGGRGTVSLAGRIIRVTPGAVQGFVDDISFSGGQIELRGWAADTDAHREADRVLVFMNGRLLTAGRPLETRPDVAKAYGEEVELSGYELTAADQGGTARDRSQLRVIAVHGERASVLPLP